METAEHLEHLLQALLGEKGQTAAKLPPTEAERRQLLRALLNVRPAVPLAEALLAEQDQLLLAWQAERTLTDCRTLSPAPLDARLFLWQGDITTLKVPAIVNAANPRLLGCFHPLHNCIDNLIHSAAGFRLRLACAALMEEQGHDEPPGGVKLTLGFCLPAAYVLHAVGPKVTDGVVTEEDRDALRACYRNCLDLAQAHGLCGVAFCCISTGCYGFPAEEAAQLAVETVYHHLSRCPTVEQVIFNVFLDRDLVLYRRLLGWPDSHLQEEPA